MWTDKQLQEKKDQGKIKGFHVQKKNRKEWNKSFQERNENAPGWNKISEKRSKEKEWLSWNLMFWCNEKALELVTELKFNEERKMRFDWAIPAIKIAIEFEGIMSEKSRHTTVTGYSKDTDKYRLAAMDNWTVLRYTVLNYKKVIEDLNQIIKGKMQLQLPTHVA